MALLKLNAKWLAALPIAAIVLAIAYGTTRPQKDAALRIACANDAAGMAITYAAKLCGDGINVEDNAVSYLQLADCCGTQAAFSLAAGEFDMAVLCPDAAALFLESGKPFVVAGGIVQNANVLVTKGGENVAAVGYMNGRELQSRAAGKSLGSGIERYPMMAAALPYALERDAVDGVVLDITGALQIQADYQCQPLPYPTASSVLVVREDVVGTPRYERFMEAYRTAVEDLNGAGLADFLATYTKTDDKEEAASLWKTMNVQFLAIPNDA